MRKTMLLMVLCMPVCVWGQKFDGLALTPPMGWNTWNTFAGNIKEDLVKETAEVMLANGMQKVGYRTIVLDDAWMAKERDGQGNLAADPNKFPDGMKALGDFLHERGFKFGIYNCAGIKTCAGFPGSRGHEYQDAMMYAKWGVDYLKYDWCNSEALSAEGAYMTMRDALYAAGRPVVFSLCEWGNNKPWLWGKKIGHLWRTTGDIYPCFDCKKDHGSWYSWGVMPILDMQKGLREYAGPDHWNDPDMMEVGNGMAVNEDRAHFTMWCMLAAPLMAGNDVRKMSKETLAILTNKEAIAVDQDRLGVQGFQYSAKDNVEVWFKPLSDGAWAMVVLNRNPNPQKIRFDWKTETVSDAFSKREARFDATVYDVRDLWQKKDLGKTDTVFDGEAAGHDVILLRLTPVK
jgi:alpha-galactosidase